MIASGHRASHSHAYGVALEHMREERSDWIEEEERMEREDQEVDYIC
jgi:hypothetical protein